MKYDRLYNFISPLTGKLPIDKGYILLGDKYGKSFVSPILIDVKQDIIDLKRKISGFDKFLGNQAIQIPIGTNEQRPSSNIIGMIRYNTEI